MAVDINELVAALDGHQEGSIAVWLINAQRLIEPVKITMLEDKEGKPFLVLDVDEKE